MEKREGIITFGGEPKVLVGSEIKVGAKAPEFTAVKNDLSEFKFSETSGKVRIISVVPSIDTGVCSLQTRSFNEDAADLGDVLILTLSMDLPFAQSRFCAAEGIDKVVMLSDYKDADFGLKYGFLIEDLRLLTRGVIVVDKDDTVKYVEYVGEVTEHPDYDAALSAARELI
ncbi:MAG: thiol peroxidase [Tissierellia bacterium]|nr:thiol peroxidase [Tissierellia bacterium]